MEVVYFVLGIVTVLLVIGIVIVVRVSTQVKDLKENLQYLERGSNEVSVDLHRRIDDELRSLTSYIDSRFDKFESKINKQKQQLPKG